MKSMPYRSNEPLLPISDPLIRNYTGHLSPTYLMFTRPDRHIHGIVPQALRFSIDQF
jgi:hypothetical protein